MVRQARFFGGVVRHLGYGTTKWILILLQDNKTDCLTSVLSLDGEADSKTMALKQMGLFSFKYFGNGKSERGCAMG